jgi:hypothetical protein
MVRPRALTAAIGLGAMALLSAAPALAATSPAPTPAAAAVGTLAVTPPSGTVDTAVDVVSSGPCGGGDHVHVVVAGKGLKPDDAFITGTTDVAGLPRNSARLLYVPLSATFGDFFGQHGVGMPKGVYLLTLRCHAALDLTSQGDFVARLSFDGKGHYQALGDASRVVPKPDGGVPTGIAAPTPATAGAHAATGSGDAHRLNGALVVGIPALLLVLGCLALLVRRRSPRSDTRPGATLQKRKVTQ